MGQISKNHVNKPLWSDIKFVGHWGICLRGRCGSKGRMFAAVRRECLCRWSLCVERGASDGDTLLYSSLEYPTLSSKRDREVRELRQREKNSSKAGKARKSEILMTSSPITFCSKRLLNNDKISIMYRKSLKNWDIKNRFLLVICKNHKLLVEKFWRPHVIVHVFLDLTQQGFDKLLLKVFWKN